MGAAALSSETVRQQRAWTITADRFAAAWAARVATLDTATAASQRLRVVFASQLILAQGHGVDAARRIIAAGTGTPAQTAQPDPATIPPRDLTHALARGWQQARRHDNVRVRRATAERIIDAHLMDAWRGGMVAAMVANTDVLGWRRIDHAGACGACFALADGKVHNTADPFPAHPRCRCIQQPVVLGVNDQTSTPTPQERWDRMTRTQQDAMFDHRGGVQKADLIRSGQVSFDDLVRVEPRRPGQMPVVAETPLKTLSPPAAPASQDLTPIP